MSRSYWGRDLKKICLARIAPEMDVCMRPFCHTGAHRTEDEQEAILEPCGTCFGSGRHIFSQEDSCGRCEGSGKQPKKGEQL